MKAETKSYAVTSGPDFRGVVEAPDPMTAAVRLLRRTRHLPGNLGQLIKVVPCDEEVFFNTSELLRQIGKANPADAEAK